MIFKPIRLFDYLKGDRYIWLIVLFLCIGSVLAVYSSTGTLAYKYRDGNTEYYLFKHFGLMLFGLGLMYVAHLINYRYYSRFAILLLIISVPLLIYTMFFGTELNEASRWMTLPVINISFQTSDLAKLALILYLARTLSRYQNNIKSREAFLNAFIPVVVICGLILPTDLSTALLLFFTCLLLMFIGRIHLKYLAGVLALFAIIGACAAILIFNLPEEKLPGRTSTWKVRIEQFIHDDAEPTYQVQQSKIAIATGGLLGKGPGRSTQRNFLPHPYSDFIYAIIIEEYGLAGGIFVLALYIFLLFRSVKIVVRTPKAFGAFLAIGLSLSLVLQAMINMAVAVNLIPVTGLTLPLVSMGGTSLLFTCISIGIILSVSRFAVQNKQIDKDNIQTQVVNAGAAT